MLGAQLRLRPVTGAGLPPETSRWTATCQFYYSSCRNISVNFNRHRRRSRLFVICSKSSRGSFNRKPNRSDERDDDDYVEAVVLISETMRHYQMRMRGFQEPRWHSSAHLAPFSFHAKDPTTDALSLGTGFFRRFQGPTIFLKISCEGEYVLPIIVGEYAVEKLIDSLHEKTVDCPDQFQLVTNVLSKLGYEAKMVKIKERVINTYFARIYFHKPGEKDILSVDARPSDAINVARRCKAPIFVNKQIVLTDAIRIVYGMERSSKIKSTYDVLLDSASDGPDLLSEELSLVRNIDLAVNDERYRDAAILRDKLLKLRESRHEL